MNKILEVFNLTTNDRLLESRQQAKELGATNQREKLADDLFSDGLLLNNISGTIADYFKFRSAQDIRARDSTYIAQPIEVTYSIITQFLEGLAKNGITVLGFDPEIGLMDAHYDPALHNTFSPTKKDTPGKIVKLGYAVDERIIARPVFMPHESLTTVNQAS